MLKQVSETISTGVLNTGASSETGQLHSHEIERTGSDAARHAIEISAPPEIIVVLGMHRSGTSLCTNVLHELGVRLDDDLIPGDVFNESGYFESREVVGFNDGIFRILGVTWNTVFSLAVPEGWVDHPTLLSSRMSLRERVLRKAASGPGTWCFKDPRTTVLLPLYETIFAQCGLRPRYIMCIRDPRAVAQSLNRRNGLPPLLSELLWLDHTMPAIRILGSRLQTFVEYNRWFTDGIAQAELLRRELGFPVGGRDLEAIVRRIVGPNLNHVDIAATGFELACSRSVYESLLAGDVGSAEDAFSTAWQALRLTTASAMPYPEQRGTSETGSYHKTEPMQRERKIMSQVFWRLEGSDFDERASTRAFTAEAATRRSVRLAIPGGLASAPQLRLDLADVPGVAQLFGIRLLDSAGGAIWEWDGQATTLAALDHQQMIVLQDVSEGGVYVYFSNSDPNLLLPECPELNSLSETGGLLEVDFDWHGTIRQEY